LAEGDDAYKIFEGLNAKGAELSQADLIRNYFFMHVGENKVDESYNTYWKPIQDKLGNSLSDYMRHYLMKDGVNVKKNEAYFTLKKRIDKLETPEVVGLLKELAQFAGYYEKLLNPEKENNQNIRVYLARLNQIGFTISYPFLLTVYADYENQQGISETQFIEVLKLLENFSVRRSICKVSTSPLNRVFIHLHKNSSRHSDFVKGVKIELSKKHYRSDIQFIEDLKTTQLDKKRDKSRQKIQFILGRLESFENKTSVNFERHTIEHILPQELTPDWKKQLGKDYQSIEQTLVNTIGNLTLSDINQKQLAKLDFFRKQKCLKKSHLHLNRYFANVTRWDKEAITQRTEVLVSIALKIWPYFGEVQTDFLALVFLYRQKMLFVDNGKLHIINLSDSDFDSEFKRLTERDYNEVEEQIYSYHSFDDDKPLDKEQQDELLKGHQYIIVSKEFVVEITKGNDCRALFDTGTMLERIQNRTEPKSIKDFMVTTESDDPSVATWNNFLNKVRRDGTTSASYENLVKAKSKTQAASSCTEKLGGYTELGKTHPKSKSEWDNDLSDYLGIDLRSTKKTVTDWSKGIMFDPENLQYMVGQKNAFKDEQTRSNLIRGIILIDGEFNPDKFFPLLDVSFVRYNQYTVLPFPFHLIKKFIQLEESGYKR